jgi:hypothetical protein
MTPEIPESPVRWKGASRLVASRYPTAGLFDRVATPQDIDAAIELEGWTNDRISGELGVLGAVPRQEWITGRVMSSVVMAAFCHPKSGGGRFNSGERGAWYAARSLETALAESAHRRTEELREVGGFETRVEMRVYLADFASRFHDIRGPRRTSTWQELYNPSDYTASQRLAQLLLDAGSNGIVYRSVRDASGECLVCFRPRLVRNVRAGAHYEFRWSGSPEPAIRRL